MLRTPARALCAVLALALAGCSPSDEGALKVATTLYPVELVAREVGGDHVEVMNVTPPGVEPHDVELGSDQVVDIIEAELVVLVGDDFQPAVEEAVDDATGETVDALEVAGGSDASSGPSDAHFWLDPTKLADLGTTVADRLSELDPENADDYTASAEDLRRRLMALDRSFEQTLAGCRARDIVTSHEAFGHLAARYGLVQTGIAGIDPEAEVSPQRIAEVIRFVRNNEVDTIFSETLLPPDAAETIARETGADIATLDPLESEPEDGNYFTAMERNRAALAKALGCR